MHAFKSIGLLDTETPFHLDSWSSLVLRSLETRLGVPIKASDPASIESALRSALPASSDIISVLKALQFLTSSPNSIPLSRKPIAAIDHFTTLLSHKLKYEPHERDIVILAHELIAKDANLGQEEVHTSSIITYGTKDASAMARCVGLPVALAALQVLDGNVRARGVWGPGVEKSVWGGVVSGLDEVGLGMRESVSLRREGRETVEGRLISDFV
jgi:alpha-aminoadipic semialdehyde synthase